MNFTDMPVWQRGHQLVLKIYAVSENFPKKEVYSLTDQIRRAIVSVTSNIAEGFGRASAREKCHFYIISMGSLREVQNQVMIARDLRYINAKDSESIFEETEQIMRMLYALVKKTNNRLRLPTFIS